MNKSVMSDPLFVEKVLKAREAHPENPDYIPPEAYPGAVVLTPEEADELRSIPGAVKGGAAPLTAKKGADKTGTNKPGARPRKGTRTHAPTEKKVLKSGTEVEIKQLGNRSKTGLSLPEIVTNADGEQVLLPANFANPNTSPADIAMGADLGAQPGEEVRMTQARLMNFNLELYHLPAVDLMNPDDVREKVDHYFYLCALHGIAPMLTGLALALKISHTSLLNMINGLGVKGKPLTSIEVLKGAHRFLAQQNEENMVYNRGNIAGNIFIAKNHYNYTDKSEVVVTPNTGEQVEKGEVLGDLDLLTE